MHNVTLDFVPLLVASPMTPVQLCVQLLPLQWLVNNAL